MLNIKKIINLGVVLVVILFFGYYIFNNLDPFVNFLNLGKENPIYFSLAVILYVIHLFLIGLIFKYTLIHYKIKISNLESTALSIITNFYNLILPLRGGALIRAKYLRKKYNFSYLKFISTFYGLYVIGFFTASIFAAISLISIILTGAKSNTIFLYPILIIFFTFFFIILFSPRFSKRKNKYINLAISVINGWQELKKNKKAIFITFLVSSLNIIILSIILLLEFKAFDIGIPFIYLIFLSSINMVSLFFSITPGSLGIKEGLIIFVLTNFGLSPEISVLISLVDRTITSITILILGPIFTHYLIKNGNNT